MAKNSYLVVDTKKRLIITLVKTIDISAMDTLGLPGCHRWNSGRAVLEYILLSIVIKTADGRIYFPGGDFPFVLGAGIKSLPGGNGGCHRFPDSFLITGLRVSGPEKTSHVIPALPDGSGKNIISGT